ncbi:hypothetical protein [Streptomyces alboflavus]|uniref:hypothetical protein n=1 Tax=Streptomyces alboflavus TaxID=67267 RepID=UPI0004BF0243|nr:hypothetical protein [Streptomyces alboflavus]
MTERPSGARGRTRTRSGAALGGAGFEGDDARSRTSEGTAPAPKRPTGQCTLTLKSKDTAYDGGTSTRHTTVKVTSTP